METLRHRLPRRRFSALLGGLLFGAYGVAGKAAAVDTQRCAGSVAAADHATFDKGDQDLSYPKINGLYQRPAATGVTLVGNNDGDRRHAGRQQRWRGE
ncbi:hypothetical protein [Dickeya dianthicola]|uniref:hypothetical protein n=1 Tax=Dickeya dianthicola TaxID=204039 RepID=UPI001F15EF42|nr:hypothetical protein [Dickeya dianthicola]